MQYKVSRLLNRLLLVILAVIALLGAGYFFIYSRYPEFRTPYLAGTIIACVLLFLFFKWMENNYDKRIITKMAEQGQIALANIKSGEREMQMRDSNMTTYWLFKFTGDILTPELKILKDATFYEKMNKETSDIPQGTVFITYDPEKPAQIFIIPNVLISHIDSLEPIVTKMESYDRFHIRYMDAYYDKGMVLKTFREEREEALREAQEAGREGKE